MLEFNVNGQTLIRTDKFEPATDSAKYLKAKFTFSDADWNDKAKLALFRRSGGDPIGVSVNTNGIAVIPAEVLATNDSLSERMHGHTIYVSLAGERMITRITTNEIAVKLRPSGYGDMKTPEEPTETVYQQLMTNYADAMNQTEAAMTEVAAVKNIFANAIKGNLSGAVVRVDDVSPVEHSPVVRVHGKNLLKNTAITQTIDGVTFTANSDGSVTANGTAGANAPVRYNLGEVVLSPGNYLVSGQSEGVTASFVMYSDQNGNNHQQHSGQDAELTLTKTAKINVYFVIMESCTVSNIKVYPMIRFASVPDSDYEPYIDPSIATVKRYGKNLLKNTLKTSSSSRGVTMTVNEDGSIVFTGTSTEVHGIGINASVKLPDGKYILTGGLSNLYLTFWGNHVETGEWVSIGTDRGSGVEIEADGSLYSHYLAQYQALANVTYNVKSNPMIRHVSCSDATYQKYDEPTIHTPASDGTVEGITSLSPDMTILTDTEGMIVECEYICDTNKVISKLTNAIVALGGTI